MELGYRKAVAKASAAVATRGLFAMGLLIVFGFISPVRVAAAQDDAKTILVSAAADMEPVFAVAGPIFERKSGYKLKVSFASSSVLTQQIQNGSPADIFFSADFYFPEQLVAANLTERRTPTAYAKGLVGLWARKDSRLGKLSLETLERPDLKSVAIANPDRAPYGRAGLAAIQRMKLYAKVSPHFVQAESVAQAAQFALSGNAEVAIVSQTIAKSPRYRDVGQFVLFPFSQYPVILQTAVILKAGKNREGAHALLNFMLSDQVQSNLPKLGLQSVK